jgi:hypothetical protein
MRAVRFDAPEFGGIERVEFHPMGIAVTATLTPAGDSSDGG